LIPQEGQSGGLFAEIYKSYHLAIEDHTSLHKK